MLQLVESLLDKPEGSRVRFPMGYLEFFIENPSNLTVASGLTQSLTEMSTRNISWGVQAADAWCWQPYCLHVPIVMKSGSLKLLDISAPLQACKGLLCLFFYPSTDHNRTLIYNQFYQFHTSQHFYKNWLSFFVFQGDFHKPSCSSFASSFIDTCPIHVNFLYVTILTRSRPAINHEFPRYRLE